MNVIRKENQVNVFFYQEDSVKEYKELQRELLDLANMLAGLSINLKLMELEDLDLQALSLLFSFCRSVQDKGSRITFFVTENLEKNLFELGPGSLPNGIERIQ